MQINTPADQLCDDRKGCKIGPADDLHIARIDCNRVDLRWP